MTRARRIAIFPGDGIGAEIVREARKVLDVITGLTGEAFDCREGLLGGAAYDATGQPFPPESLALAREADAVLLGAVGGPQWESLPYELQPERALLGLREKLGLYANVRPVRAVGCLLDASPLKAHLAAGVDIVILRELTGDIYFGTPRGIKTEEGRRVGINTMRYTEEEIRRIVRMGFQIARSRRKNLCSVDKANVLETSRLWRAVAGEEAKAFPEVALRHLYVDNCAMQLVLNPAQFDVIVTGNLFGDILSDEAAVLTGSIGMLPSASLGAETALYEPIHGSAPDIAGRNVANPLAMILSVAMMFTHSFDRPDFARAIEVAVAQTLAGGLRTADLHREGTVLASTTAMGDAVCSTLKSSWKRR